MSATLVAVRRETRLNYRTLRLVGYGRCEARRHAIRFAQRAAMVRACAMLANEPGGWNADGEYVCESVR